MNIQQARNEAFSKFNQIGDICLTADANADLTVAPQMYKTDAWLTAWHGSVVTMLGDTGTTQKTKDWYALRGIVE